LTLTNEEVIKLLDDYDRETKALKKYIYKLVWYMRGGINLDQMFEIGYQDREIINKLIEENIETTNKTGLLLI
jgi:phosphoenolpyruvate synthase/pyruvate phosphate dikinase